MSQSEETQWSRGWLMLPFGLGALALYWFQKQSKESKDPETEKKEEIEEEIRHEFLVSQNIADSVKTIDLGPLSD